MTDVVRPPQQHGALIRSIALQAALILIVIAIAGGAAYNAADNLARQRAGHRYRQRHRVPATAPAAQASRIRTRPGDQTKASGGADLCLPRRGLCRDPLLLALTAFPHIVEHLSREFTVRWNIRER